MPPVSPPTAYALPELSIRRGANGEVGTAGCILSPAGAGSYVLVSCAHILGWFGQLPNVPQTGTSKILCPAKRADGSPNAAAQEIATLGAWFPDATNTAASTITIDAGYATIPINPGLFRTIGVPELLAPPGSLPVNARVRFRGAHGGLQFATVQGIAQPVHVTYQEASGNPVPLNLSNLVLCTRADSLPGDTAEVSLPGDSGAGVYLDDPATPDLPDTRRPLLGIVVGTSKVENGMIYCRIEDILNRFSLGLVDPGLVAMLNDAAPAGGVA